MNVNLKNYSRVSAAAAAPALVALMLTAACGYKPPLDPAQVKRSHFESEAWGVALDYPADWKATPGADAAPLVVEITAPGKEETAGAGVSVVAGFSAAPLDDVAAAYKSGLKTAGFLKEMDSTLAGNPARVFEYAAVGVDGAQILNRTLVTRFDERAFIITFSSYKPQYETTRPYFDIIEKSLRLM